MQKQIIVHCKLNETHVALLDGEQLIEFESETTDERQLVGSIYIGRVMNVLPGIQAAFIDIGLGKNAFIHIDDLLPVHLEQKPTIKPSISELVAKGQHILVQMMKEPLKSKGARVTTHFSIPGRFLVYMPYADYVGVSRKINEEKERIRLKEIIEEYRETGEGFIARTVAQGETAYSLQDEMVHLRDLWAQIRQGAARENVPQKIFQDSKLISRCARDLFTEHISYLWVDDIQMLAELKELIAIRSPELADRIHYYKGQPSILSHFSIDNQLAKAFQKRITLANGGYLIWEHTEALTVIDVNTGKYVGDTDAEETILNTNLIAATEIARLLRLRDVGGIIIVDFIDMQVEEHREKVRCELEAKLVYDRTKTIVVGWTQLGLMEITRKKTRRTKVMEVF